MNQFRAVLNQALRCGVLLCLAIISGNIVNGQIVAGLSATADKKPSVEYDVDARVTVEEMQDGVYGQIYRMKISPAAEPSPAFKHRFCVPPRDTIPANAATLYLRSFGERSLSGPEEQAYEKHGDDFYEWQSIEGVPIEALLETPAKEVSQTFDEYIKGHIERATYCRYCDWGLGEEDLKGPGMLSFLLPSVQSTRSISRVLALQTRVAIAEKRFDRAAELIRMNYQLGRNVGKMKFLVASLVGLAEVGITNGTLIDMIAATDSPNMYYALTELPRPVVNFREAMRMEMTMVEAIFPDLFEAEGADLSVEAWREIVKQFFNAYTNVNMAVTSMPSNEDRDSGKTLEDGPSLEQLGLRLAPTLVGILGYGTAKQQLLDAGEDSQKIEAMPVAQVIAISAARSIRKRSNDNERWIYQPFDVAMRGMEAEERAMLAIQNTKRLVQPGEILTSMLLPASQQVFQAQARVQRDIDALRVIEAIRMHAAQTGALPATLDEISVVPVPLNPATNQPFSYQLQGGTATLELPRSDGIVFSKRFEIRL